MFILAYFLIYLSYFCHESLDELQYLMIFLKDTDKALIFPHSKK